LSGDHTTDTIVDVNGNTHPVTGESTAIHFFKNITTRS